MPRYDRDAIVQAMRALYEMVIRMGILPTDPPITLHTPSADWTPPAKFIHKSPAVIDLMRHLPYPSQDLEIAPSSTAVDYARENYIGRFFAEPKPTFDCDVNADELVLTMGDAVSRVIFIVDTTTGR